MVGKNWLAGALLVATVFAPEAVRAQSADRELLPMPTALAPQPGRFGRASPGVSASSPLAFGPNWRDVFAGVGYQATTRFGGDDDASVSAGFGLGNSVDAVGLEVVVTSMSTVRSGFMNRSVVGFKAHRSLPGNAAIAVGVEGTKLTGDFTSKESVYGVISKVVALRDDGFAETPFSSMTISGGLGNGRFCAEETVGFVHGLKDCGVNFFGSVGLRANQWSGLIADWTGQDLNLGISLAPFSAFPLVITPTLADVTGSAGDKVRFTLGAGFGLRF
ncbi:MAG: hypothetical protein ACYC3L_15175 [Gemmatimonadaceae bacterium]